MTKALVVSSYARDLSWLNDVEGEIFVYDKNNRELTFPGKEHIHVEHLENVGREPHTFMYHIATHYDDLADVTYFSQDDPFEHLPDFLELYNKNVEGWLGQEVLVCDRKGQPHHPGPLPLKRVARLVGVQLEDEVSFKAGCLLALTREHIQRHERSYYEKLARLMERHPTTTIFGPFGPHGLYRTPWALERLWGKMFDIA